MKKTLLFSLLAIYCKCFGQNADLGTLKNNGNNFKFIAIGSSLSAGVKNGGLFATGQENSFPSLIAKQIGIISFKQPTLENNGTGYQTVIEKKEGTLKIEKIKGKDDTNGDSPLPKVTYEIDNFSIPYLKAMYLDVQENQQGAFLNTFDRRCYAHLNRFAENKDSYFQNLQKKISKLDFFTYEIGTDDFVSYYFSGGYGQDISFMTRPRESYFPESEVIKFLKSKGAKGVIANIPNVLKFPYFSYYSNKKIVEKFGNYIYIEQFGKNNVRVMDNRDIFLPKSDITDLFEGVGKKGLSIDNPLLDEDVISYEEQVSVDSYNSYLDFLAKSNNIPLVNLRNLFDKILSGNYVTEDGIKIIPNYPNGNFFSTDGVTPTALGQAIIANEFIKKINEFYSSKIPLLNTINFTK